MAFEDVPRLVGRLVGDDEQVSVVDPVDPANELPRRRRVELEANHAHRLAAGEPVTLPDLGLGVLHHVHADDVAQAFERALARPGAIGSSFHVVAEQAMTLRGLAYGAAAWWGREPVLEYVDWDEYERRVGEEHASVTREHVGRSIAADISRARSLLDYAPRYSALEALRDAVFERATDG